MNGQFINVRTDMSDRNAPLKDSEGDMVSVFPGDDAMRRLCNARMYFDLASDAPFLPVPSVLTKPLHGFPSSF